MKIFQIKTWWIFLLVLLTINNQVFADDVVHLDKDQKAPYEGILFSNEKAKDLRVKLLERDTFEQLNESLENTTKSLYGIIKTKDEQNDLITKRNNDLVKELQSERTFTTLERIGWFAIGVATTILTVYGVRKATQ